MSVLRVISLLAISICNGCDEPRAAETSYEIAFQAVDDRGKSLDDIAITVGETLLGQTEAGGSLRVQVQAREGQRFPLHAPCQEGYQPK